MSGRFLFSIDLEDIRARIPDGYSMPPRVSINTRRILDFLEAHRSYCTFFVVGELAEQEPALIRMIAERGHEIACHSQKHEPLSQLGPDGFREDLRKNLQSLARAGVRGVTGFRAPRFSLNCDTAWAYPILEDLGFTYSSSVLPAPNPISGWPGFGESPRRIGNILEIPITLTSLPAVRIPVAGGVYFRFLPQILSNYLIWRSVCAKGYVTSYFHPYDVDHEEDYRIIPELNGNRLHNWLFYYNRRSVLPKLRALMRRNLRITTYKNFAEGF